ncbi:hypothetical protein L4D09_27525 [Photobacterium makurazakiensis]|uniref:hypothetical protein n=1 Tax=Photobacterium makurazakiensis TaxID=2910234 RepID=UPI003D0C843C
MNKLKLISILLFSCVTQVKADISGNDLSYEGWVQLAIHENSIDENTTGNYKNYKFNESVISSLEQSKQVELEELVVMASKEY